MDEDTGPVIESATEDRVRIRPFRVLPGGASAIRTEWYAAGIMLGALAVLWLMRRAFPRGQGHVHASGIDAVTFLMYYLIVQGFVRLVAGNLAEKRGEGDSLSSAVAFYA